MSQQERESQLEGVDDVWETVLDGSVTKATNMQGRIDRWTIAEEKHDRIARQLNNTSSLNDYSLVFKIA